MTGFNLPPGVSVEQINSHWDDSDDAPPDSSPFDEGPDSSFRCLAEIYLDTALSLIPSPWRLSHLGQAASGIWRCELVAPGTDPHSYLVAASTPARNPMSALRAALHTAAHTPVLLTTHIRSATPTAVRAASLEEL